MKGYFIQYKFILPKETKHSSYTYQKLFRAIYGYTQNVSKGGGRVYKYYRKGVLSDIPYLRPGKNSVIIPPTAFNQLITFLKTGKNPTHYWRSKGDWKAVYYMDEKQLPEADIITALENLVKRLHISGENGDVPLSEQLVSTAEKKGGKNKEFRTALLAAAEPLVSNEWFRTCYGQSSKLTAFFDNYTRLKQTP
jgi:hypothetical protein